MENLAPQTKSDGQYASSFHNKGNVSGNVTVDWNDGNYQRVRLTGNATFAFTNGVAGGRYMLDIAYSGAQTPTFPSSPTVQWNGGSAPTFTSAATKKDKIALLYDGVSYDCGAALNYADNIG